MSKEKVKTKRGITLIALVITIIVMLILVAVTVNVAIQGGLLAKTNEASLRLCTLNSCRTIKNGGSCV